MIQFKKADFLRLAEIVHDETGNDIKEKNFSMLESRLRTHLMKLKLSSVEEYWQYFSQHEDEERETLQGLMTTHYTFFFREYVHFEALQKWLQEQLPRLKNRYQESKAPVRVWSAASSRGQEAYSLALFLEVNLFKKHGIPYEIVGTDIDADSVAYAKNGVYPIKEVNTISQTYLSGYWKKGTGSVKDYAAINPEMRTKVRFETLNLLEVDRWSEKKDFDVIFCRNVFIYFVPEKIEKIALSLVKKLDPLGLLISGVSEPLRFEGWDLESVGPSCYRRVVPKTAAVSAVPVQQVEATSEQKKYRVLCVDDSRTIQVLMKKIFSQDKNCEKVDIAENGNEARKKLDSGTYDVVTLDIHMPEVNGIEFLERLYNWQKDPPVIMVSSVNRTDLELATKSMSLGAFDYVEKPAMNNLQKCAGEILTKVKMALRLDKRNLMQAKVGGFDESISQKIVVPDATQCARIVVASSDSYRQLEQVVKGQVNEYRSPSLLIFWNENNSNLNIENDIMKWSDRPLIQVRDDKQLYKPNTIYVINMELAEKILPHLKAKSISLQILDGKVLTNSFVPKGVSLQILLDESLAANKENVESRLGIKISDLTPATSFPSLSVEYFANLRKSVA